MKQHSLKKISILSFLFIFSLALFTRLYTYKAVYIKPELGIWILSDAIFAGLFSCIILVAFTLNYKARLTLLSTLMLVIWPITNWLNMESLYSLNQPIDLSDAHYAADKDFIINTLNKLEFSKFYIANTLILAVFVILLSTIKPVVTHRSKKIVWATSITFALALLLAAKFLTDRSYSWSETHPIFWTISNYSTSFEDPTGPIELTNVEVNLEQNLYKDGEAGEAKNVLLIVLEGIPGSYIRSTREYLDMPQGDQFSPLNFYMPNLSRIAEDAQVTPNFIAHSRQTIRGMYSMLCGDYSKLSTSTLKSLEYVSLPAKLRPSCLPSTLTAQGYKTVFLQAAPLEFMGKDEFMAAVGYQEVMGRESFHSDKIKYSWGPDDSVFMDKALETVANLREANQPWFLTLLTVGTHQPYLVPEKFAERYPNRKLASVAFLDSALHTFFSGLKRLGVPEDTLIIITSDESHGVADQPYGGNWGLNLALAPDLKKSIQPGVFGLLDTSRSILDYLGLSDLNKDLGGRSIFRSQSEYRSLMFYRDKIYKTLENGVVGCTTEDNCVIYKTNSSNIFSSEYSVEKIDNIKSKDNFFKSDISPTQLARHFDSSLNQRKQSESDGDFTLKLISNKEFRLKDESFKTLTSGQYFSIPTNHYALFDITINNVNSKAPHNIAFSLDHLDGQKEVSIDLPFKTPILDSGDTVNIKFKLNAKDRPLLQVKPTLRLSRQGNQVSNTRVDFTIAVKKMSEVNIDTVLSETELVALSKVNQNGQEAEFTAIDGKLTEVSSYSVGSAVSFAAGKPGSNYLISGWSVPEGWGTWTDGLTSIIGFYLGDSPDGDCDLILKSQSFYKPERQVYFAINDSDRNQYIFASAHEWENVVLENASKYLKRGLNLIKIQNNDVHSPYELNLSEDRRALGIGVEGFEIACD